MRAALLLVAGTLVAGCYDAHVNVPGTDASISPIDAARDAARDSGVDAPPDAPPDAGQDGGLCDGVFEEPMIQLCSFANGGGLPAGEASGVTIFYGACTCGMRTCSARIVGDLIELDTFSCPEPEPPCDDCTNDLFCPTPPLAPGDYHLRVDGRLVGTITAADSPPIARPTCWAPQEPTDLVCDWPGAPRPADRMCHRPLEDVGTQVEIDLLFDGAPCEAPGECRVRQAGFELHVSWTRLACDAPGTGCVASPGTIVRCLTPPLRDGDYTIVVDDESGLRSTLEIRDITRRGEVMCVGGAAPGGAP